MRRPSGDLVDEDIVMRSQLTSGDPRSGLADEDPSRLADEAVAAFERRQAPARDLAEQAADIVDAAFAMAVRFHQGGKLFTFGIGAACADAQHIAVEFVHPVIVGKRALPAISLTSDVATVTAIAASAGLTEVFSYQLRKLAEPADIALGLCVGPHHESVLAGLRSASDAGLLTIALTGGARTAPAAELATHVLTAASDDACVVKELHVTIYHLLWELVHVFIEQPSVLRGGTVRS
jgi:D-sedoheptulose 7-phosphate isomerase